MLKIKLLESEKEMNDDHVFKTKIGGITHYVQVNNLLVNRDKPIPTVHNILLIDRSRSMWDSIDSLVDQVISVIDNLSENDRYSVIWYSGIGQMGRIITNIKKSFIGYEEILNKFKSVVGATCFSEPINEAYNIQSPDSDYTVVTLFTDGVPVVPWNYDEELEKCVNTIKSNPSVLAFNSIAYGSNTDYEFLLKLSNSSALGRVYNESDISTFLDTYKLILNSSKGFTNTSVKINSSNSEILYLTDKNISLKHNTFSLPQLQLNNHNVFYTVSTKNPQVDIDTEAEIEYPEITQEIKDDFYYAYAYQLYYNGNRMKALDIIVNNVRDLHLAELMTSAFTFNEVKTATDNLYEAALNHLSRLKDGKCPPKYLPKKDAYCVFDLISDFMQSKAYYIPNSKNVESYNRIRRKRVDTLNRFTSSNEIIRTPINNVVWNEEKINLSIPFAINGFVKLNPLTANRVNLPQEYPARIIRSHAFINNGELNIKRAEFIVSDKLLEKLFKNNVKFTVISNNEDNTSNVVIELNSIPLINRQYIEDVSLEDITLTCNRILDYKAEQKILNFMIKEQTNELYPLGYNSVNESKELTAEQVEVLNENGIRHGIYQGIDNELPAAKDCDYYYTRLTKFYLKGFASLPSMNEFFKMYREERKFNPAGLRMKNSFNKINTILLEKFKTKNASKESLQTLSDMLDKVRYNLLKDNTKLNAIKMSRHLNNEFFEGLKPDNKGNYNFDYKTFTLVFRNDRVKEYIN